MLKLAKCIAELNVDIPLYSNNTHQAIKIDFQDISNMHAKQIVADVLSLAFSDERFCVCEFGCGTAEKSVVNHLISSSKDRLKIIPFVSKLDKDWFEYEDNAITCADIDLSELLFDSYMSYVFSAEFLSNTVFLIAENKGIVCYVYDRRGMDVVSTDRALIQKLISEFSPYILCTPI